MSKIKALLTGILNIILFIPCLIFWGYIDILVAIGDGIVYIGRSISNLLVQTGCSIKNYFIRVKSFFKSFFRSVSPNFIKVVPQKHEVYKDPVEILIDECLKTASPSGSRFFRSYYHKSDKAIEALAEVMCPHGEFGCGKIECNIFKRDRKKNFEIKKEQFEREYVMNTFHRNHRWRLEFGNKEDDTMLLWARSAKIIKKPTFFKKGLIEVTFYSKPIVIDYLARKPKAKVARLSFTEGQGNLMSYIEFKKFKLKEVDITSLDFDYTSSDFDYTSSDITTVKAYFSFSKSKFYGTVTTNGPMEKAVT